MALSPLQQAYQFISSFEEAPNNTYTPDTAKKASNLYDKLFQILSSKDDPEFTPASITIFSLIQKVEAEKVIDSTTCNTWFNESYEKVQIYASTDPEMKGFLNGLMENHVVKNLKTISIKNQF